MRMPVKIPVYYLLALAAPAALAAQPLFDTHLHYNSDQAQQLGAEQVVQILQRNDVRGALVTSTPPALVLQLQRQAPQRILPMLGVYREAPDKEHWFADDTLPEHIEAQLKQGGWRAIGELHLFAQDRDNPVFRRIVELAGQYRLPLMLHTDPAVIDKVYDIAPDQVIIWSHAGTFPYPELIRDYLHRYPKLYVDLSVRDERIAPQGDIADDWYELLATYGDRFLVGVDTFSLGRWQKFDQATARIRHWLDQLPAETRDRIAYRNAARLFGDTPPQGQP